MGVKFTLAVSETLCPTVIFTFNVCHKSNEILAYLSFYRAAAERKGHRETGAYLSDAVRAFVQRGAAAENHAGVGQGVTLGPEERYVDTLGLVTAEKPALVQGGDSGQN